MQVPRSLIRYMRRYCMTCIATKRLCHHARHPILHLFTRPPAMPLVRKRALCVELNNPPAAAALIATRHSSSSLPASVEEQAVFGVLHDPLQAFLQVFTGHGAASHDLPLVRADVAEMQSLCCGRLGRWR